jgi:ethanolamine transporter EutH
MTTLTLLASLCCIFFAIGLCFAPNAILAGLLILAATCLFLTSIALAEREGWGRG